MTSHRAQLFDLEKSSVQQRPSDFEAELLTHLPVLRKQAMSLCRNRDTRDDMVQETICRALYYRDKFEMGTNMGAWLCTILRNAFYASIRRDKYTAEDPDEKMALGMVCHDDPVDRIVARETLQSICSLPAAYRDPLLLIAVDGATYDEVAVECMMQEGTVKSRVHRGRIMLGARQ
jgi:RNA polymerase sigma-70 factor (ECF subfamily)